MTPSAKLLRSDDFCHRKAFLEREWEKWALTPIELLRRSIEYGLESEAEDPGQDAGDYHLTLCTQRGIDADSDDLLGIADHGSALADLLVWILRNDGPSWQRPEDVENWHSGAYLTEQGLRQVWLTDRWDTQRQVAAEHSWAVAGETAAYELPMTLLVCIIGNRREDRWWSPFSTGFTHPVSGDLRFQKRDGEPFRDSWNRVWREKAGFSREEWLEALVEDGVIAENLMVHPIEIPRHHHELRNLAASRMEQAGRVQDLPAPHLSQCDAPLTPCQFRSCCPNWTLPSEQNGFLRLQPGPQSPQP